MFKEKTIKYFEFDDVNYCVEVIESDQNVEFWLQKKDYGVKSLMFGFPKEALNLCNEYTTYEDTLLGIIRANILDSIRIYERQYC